MRPVNRIIIHCSDSWWGTAAEINRWHLARGWRGIGYHYTILNGYPLHADWQGGNYQRNMDGIVETGRPLEQTGAHVAGHNLDSIGICLIGRRLFSAAQLDALASLVDRLAAQCAIPITAGRVVGHYELDPGKSCPNMDMRWLRDFLRRAM